MKVLVAVASKYGATWEIGERLQQVLTDAGHEARLERAEEAELRQEDEAVVLGSAVYVGRWLEPARSFADRYGEELSSRPVWLFSSGPLGEPDPRPEGDPQDVPELVERLGARAHRVFPGSLDPRQLSFVMRALIFAMRAPTGDDRDWDAVESWGREIAAELERR